MFGHEYTYRQEDIQKFLSLHPEAYQNLGLQTQFGYGLLGLKNSDSLYMDLPRGLEFCTHRFSDQTLSIDQIKDMVSVIITRELFNSNQKPYTNDQIITLAKLHNAILEATYCQNLSNAVSFAFGNTIAALQWQHIAKVTDETRKLYFKQGRWIFIMEGKIKIIQIQTNRLHALESEVLKFKGKSILDLQHVTPWNLPKKPEDNAPTINSHFPDGFILQKISFSGDHIWAQRLNDFLSNPCSYRLPSNDPFGETSQLQGLAAKLNTYLKQNDPGSNGSSPLVLPRKLYYDYWAGPHNNPDVQASAARKLLEAIKLHLCPQSLTPEEKKSLLESPLSKVVNGQTGLVASLFKMMTVD